LDKQCSYCGSNIKIYKLEQDNKYYCAKHYQQIKKYGVVQQRTRLDKNEIIESENCITILCRNNKQDIIAKIIADKEDFELLSKYKWTFCKSNGYATTYIYSQEKDRKIQILMHRLIMNPIPKEQIDHIDGNKLNNQKSNLRLCSNQQNTMNQHKNTIIGVCWHKNSNKWRGRIMINGKDTCVGYFDNYEDAVKHRLKLERDLFGEFAPQKYLFEQYGIKDD
jgi:hypothetical protein